jgi:hypothetical protein
METQMIKLDESKNLFFVDEGVYKGTTFTMDDFQFGYGESENVLSYDLDIRELHLNEQQVEVNYKSKLAFNESVVIEFITSSLEGVAKGQLYD